MRYVLLILPLLLLGCGASRPAWVDRADEARYPSNRYLTATGSASLSGGESRALGMAEQSAKKSLAAQIRSSVKSVEKTLLSETLAISKDGVQGSSTESLQQQIQENVDQTLAGMTILDHFRDREQDVLYALAGIDLSELKRIVVEWGQNQDADVVPLVLKARKAAAVVKALQLLDQASRKLQPAPPAYYTLKNLLPAFVGSAKPEYSLADLEALAVQRVSSDKLIARYEAPNVTVAGLVPGLAFTVNIEPARQKPARIQGDATGKAVMGLGKDPWTDAAGFVSLSFSPDPKGMGLAGSLAEKISSVSLPVRVKTNTVHVPVVGVFVATADCPSEVSDRLLAAASRCWSASGWQSQKLAADPAGQISSGHDAALAYAVRCEAPKTVMLGGSRLYTVRLGLDVSRAGMDPAHSAWYASGANQDRSMATVAAVENLEEKLCAR